MRAAAVNHVCILESLDLVYFTARVDKSVRAVPQGAGPVRYNAASGGGVLALGSALGDPEHQTVTSTGAVQFQALGGVLGIEIVNVDYS